MIPALGHELKEEIIKKPTCGEAGSKKISCVHEGYAYKEMTRTSCYRTTYMGDHCLECDSTYTTKKKQVERKHGS